MVRQLRTGRVAAIACCGLIAPATAVAAPQERIPAVTLPMGDGVEFRHRLLSWLPPRMSDAGVPVAFRLPSVVTRISSYFGVRGDPLTRTRRLHAGIDLPDRFGAPVVSSARGDVVVAGWTRGYGNMVEIDHGDGVRTRYAHLSRILVAVGQAVDGGEAIGRVGSTGRSTGNHLHFEIRQDGRATDPLTFAWQQPLTRAEPVVVVRQRGAAWTSGPGGTRLPMPSLD